MLNSLQTLAVTRQVLDAKHGMASDDPEKAVEARPQTSEDTNPFAGDNPPTLQTVRQQAIETEEKRYLQRLMAFTKGDIKQSCRISQLSRSRLYDLLKKYQLTSKNG